jgi:hypothetical protein
MMNECPNCGGMIWNNIQKNRDRIAQSKKPMPDYKCKDEACGWKQWPPKGQNVPTRPKSGPRWTWGTLSGTYANCLKLAAKHIKEAVPNATPADLIAATATLFITAARDGVQPIEKPQPKPPLEADEEDEVRQPDDPY